MKPSTAAGLCVAALFVTSSALARGGGGGHGGGHGGGAHGHGGGGGGPPNLSVYLHRPPAPRQNQAAHGWRFGGK